LKFVLVRNDARLTNDGREETRLCNNSIKYRFYCNMCMFVCGEGAQN